MDSTSCNDESFTVLNLTRFANLRVLEVGNNSFCFVNEVHLIGLPNLERVVIGENSFTKQKRGCSKLPDHNFYLKNCERLSELKIGLHSFNGYSLIEIENVPSLEVIEIGEMEEGSCNFAYASLELKSEIGEMK